MDKEGNKPDYHKRAQLDVNGHMEVVKFMRELPPAHFMVRIESFSRLLRSLRMTKRDKYECAEFSEGGYKWSLCIYPEGNKKENGEGHISLYLMMTDILEPSVTVDTSLKFFVLDRVRLRYLTILDIREKHYHAAVKEWGVPTLLPQSIFHDDSYGFLIDDSCIFGVEASVIRKTTIAESGSKPLLTEVKESDLLLLEPKPNTYHWVISDFSKPRTQHYTPVFGIKGYQWKMSLYPRGFADDQDNYLSIFLWLHDLTKVSCGKKLVAEFVVTLKDQRNGKDHIKRDSFGFHSRASGWSGSDFLPLTEFEKHASDFIVNDSVIIEVTIEAAFLVDC